MNNGREKRRLLGMLALLAPLPLPLNDALEWWFLGLYVLALGAFFQRAERDHVRWLSNRALNLLGLAYFPVLFFDGPRSVASGRVLDPLLHLILFLVAVKLFSLRRERDKWHVLIAVFFVFASSMATSSHLTIVFFLLAFVALAMFTLTRFVHLFVIGGLGLERQSPAAAVDLGRPLVAGVLLVLLLAVPVFAMLPRFGDPFILGHGALGSQRIAGFSDEVDLSQTSAIRGNRTVVMRLAYDRGRAPADIRLKGATYDRYENERWQRQQQRQEADRVLSQGNRFWLIWGPRRPVNEAEVFLQPLGSRSLVLPLEAVGIDDLPIPYLDRDAGGAYSLPFVPREPLRFRVRMVDEPVIMAATDEASLQVALDTSGVTERMRGLAAQVMGEGTDAERIDRLERYLLENHTFSLDLVGASNGEPLARFLFEERRGHCELFASSMVLLLRSEGIPARLVAGFLGVEHNALEGYDVVRQDNAHAWVEAYDREAGWRVFDPTPPDGRPTAAPWSLRMAVAQLYDAMIFRWDRYVLSFGSADQASLIDNLREAFGGLWQAVAGLFGGDDQAASSAPDASLGDPLTAEPPPGPAHARPRRLLLLLPFAFALFAVAWVTLRGRATAGSAERAYARLRHRLRRIGQPVTDATAPASVVQQVIERAPAAATAARRLVGLYLEESFGERALDGAERRQVQLAFAEVAGALRKRRRQRA